MHRATKIKQNSQTGFTLIELLVVFSIISLLASVLIVTAKSARDKARYAVVISDSEQLSKAMSLYFANYGSYPTGNLPVYGWAAALPDVPDAFSGLIQTFPVPQCEYWGYTLASTPTSTYVTIRKYNPGHATTRTIGYYCMESKDGCQSVSQGYGPINFWQVKTVTCSE